MIDGAHLAALWGIAVAQPMFQLVHEELLPTATWSRAEVAVFAVGFALLPPALMLLAELTVGLIGDGPRRALHLIFVGGLAAVFAGYVTKLSAPDNGPLIAAATVIGGVAAVLAFVRFEPVRMFLTVLGAAPLVFIALVVIRSPSTDLLPATDVAHARVAVNGPPVVLVIFDEFPAASIMDGNGRLDAKRLPNFARLARDGTWFPNATSLADSTFDAIPAILTGRNPGRDDDGSDYPGNLFTLLAGGYRMNVQERVTRLCPADLCAENAQPPFGTRVRKLLPIVWRLSLRRFLPRRVVDRLFRQQGSEDPQRPPRRFEQRIRGGGRPALNVMHAFLPHSPWFLLPDGRRYRSGLENRALFPAQIDPTTGFVRDYGDSWTSDASRVRQAHQAHLAQVGGTDGLLGRILRRLKATGQYERSLIIVTADHGVAFDAEQPSRRLRRANAPQIINVPLFVKRPRQRRGRVDPAFVRTSDIVPTIAEVVGVDLPWRADGQSLLSPRSRERLDATSVTDDRFSFSPQWLKRARDAVAWRQAQLFGGGTTAVELFEFGPRRELLGRTSSAVRRAGLAPAPVQLDRPEALQSVDPRTEPVPASISGRMSTGRAGDIAAVVVNGRVAAITHTYRYRGKLSFVALIPPSALRPGTNRVEIYAARGGARPRS